MISPSYYLNVIDLGHLKGEGFTLKKKDRTMLSDTRTLPGPRGDQEKALRIVSPSEICSELSLLCTLKYDGF